MKLRVGQIWIKSNGHRLKLDEEKNGKWHYTYYYSDFNTCGDLYLADLEGAMKREGDWRLSEHWIINSILDAYQIN